MKLAVTTNGKCSGEVQRAAREAAVRWGLPFLPRKRKSPLLPMFAQAEALLVFS